MMSTDPLAFTRIICGIVVQMSWINSNSNAMGDHQFFSRTLSLSISAIFKLYINKCIHKRMLCHIFIYIHAHLNIIRCTQYDGHLLISPCFSQFQSDNFSCTPALIALGRLVCVCVYLWMAGAYASDSPWESDCATNVSSWSLKNTFSPLHVLTLIVTIKR